MSKPMKIRDLNVDTTEVARLKPYPRNARTHSKKQVRQIADSIVAFGWTNPILIDGQGGVIAGHGRLEAAKMLKLDTVPTIHIKDMSEAQKRAYILADNKLAENARWDRDVLAIELGGLLELETEFEITTTGFEMAEIDLAIGEASNAESDEDDQVPDADPEAPIISKPGDLWILGDHQLMCGDALDSRSYERLMDGEQARMVITDPPYNVPIDGHVSGLGKHRHRDFAMASGEMTSATFTEFLTSAFDMMAANSTDGSLHFVFMDWRHLGEIIAAGNAVYSDLKNICIWAKTNGGMGSLYRSAHELVLVFKVGAAPHINNVDLGRFGRNRTNVWTYPGAASFGANRDEALAMHPTVKPVALVADAMLDCSRRKDLILDPFAGSGTVLIAAERTGRHARAIELDPAYVDAAVRRWQAKTGKAATHAETGDTFNDIAAHIGADFEEAIND